jgi:hypothetical protein
MQLSNIRVLALCLGGGLVLGIVGGSVYAMIADKIIAYGIGTALLVIGVIAMALGLLGATEPPEGWSLKRRVPGDATPRRGFAARATYANPTMSRRVSSASLAIWGVVVGGGLIAFGAVAFSFAQ